MKNSEQFIKCTEDDNLRRVIKFHEYFSRQYDLLERIEKGFLEINERERMGGLYPLLNSVMSGAISTDILVQKGLLTEAYITARAFLERITNLCYLLVCGETEYQDFIEYSQQKVVRSLISRQKAYSLIGHEIAIPKPPELHQKMKAMMKKFEKPSGKEKGSWTVLTIEKRMEYVGTTVSSFRTQGYLAIKEYLYADASESIHGTLYGAMFHTGILYGLKGDKAVGEKYLHGLRANLYMMLGLLIEALCKVVGDRLGGRNIGEEAEENFEVIGKALGMKKAQPNH